MDPDNAQFTSTSGGDGRQSASPSSANDRESTAPSGTVDHEDHLDAALDGLPRFRWPDPALAETAERLRTLAVRAALPEPTPAFVQALAEQLMSLAATTPAPVIPQTVGANGHHPELSIPGRPMAVAGGAVRRVSTGALATAAAVVLLLGGIGFGGWLASSPGDDGEPRRLGAGTAGTATAARPELCVLVSSDAMAGGLLDGTPRPRLVFPPEEPIYERSLPTGPEAGAEVVAGVEATVREIAACGSAGRVGAVRVVGSPEAGAWPTYVMAAPAGGGIDDATLLYSANYLAWMERIGNGAFAVWTPTSSEGITVRDVRVLDDGRVGAIVDDETGKTFVVFVAAGNRWVVDETWLVTDPPVTPETFSPDFFVNTQFAVNLRAESNSRSEIITILQPGTRIQYLGETVAAEDPAQDGPRWLKFRTRDGDVGWLREIDVFLESWAMAPTVVATRGFEATHRSNPEVAINLRSEPSTTGGNGTVVTVLPPGTPLVLVGEPAPAENPADDGPRWWRVRTVDGAEGWLRQIDIEPRPGGGSSGGVGSSG